MRSRAGIVSLACLALIIYGTAAVNAGTVYALDLRGDNELLSFPVNAPAPNVIAGVSYDAYSMDFDSLANNLYAITVPDFVLGTIDTSTGAFTTVAPVTGIGSGENTTGMSVDPTDETFYLSTAVLTDVYHNYLYKVDPTTGVATVVTELTGNVGSELFIDIAIDASGQMFAHDIGNDALYIVDKTTGASTYIGPTGYAANYAQGMDFDYETNTLYATIYTGGGTGAFVWFDLNTGMANQIVSTTPWDMEMEMAIDSPIPEPASLSLLALAGLVLLRRR
jgi:hypothetical protein